MDEQRRREGEGEGKGGDPRTPQTGAPGGPGRGSADDEERDHARRIQRDRRARLATALTVLTLVVLFVVFISQNIDERPTIDFLLFHFEVSVIWIFLVVAILGGVVGYLLGRPSRRLRLHDRKEKR